MLDAGDFAITVVDDIPIAGTATTMIIANSLLNASNTADLDFTIGADEPGAFTLTQAMGDDGGTAIQVDLIEGNDVFGLVDGVVTQMSSDGVFLVWHQNPDGSWSAVLTGTTGGQAQFVAATVFTVTVNADGTYTVTLDDTLQLDGVADPFQLNFAGGGVSGGNNEQLIFFDSTEPDNNTEGTTDGMPDGIPDGSTIMAVAVGYLEDGTIGLVNSSIPGMGISDANTIDVDDGGGVTSEELRVFLGEPADPADITATLNDGFSLGEEGVNTNDIDFTEKPIGFLKITLDNLNGDGTPGDLNVSSKDEFAIIGVVIEGTGIEGAGDVVWFKVEGQGSGASSASDEEFIIQQGMEVGQGLGGTGTFEDPYVVDMQFAADGTYTGTGFVEGEFAALLFQADVDSGSSYRVVAAEGKGDEGGFDIGTTFTTTATDADGDAVDTTFNVDFISGTVLTGTEFSDLLKGNGDSDTIFGGGGDDILVGNGGADILTGGTGSDTFDFNAITEGGDTITDFSTGEGDQLDISDLLTGLGLGGTSYADLVTAGNIFQDVGDFDSDADAADVNFYIDPTGASTSTPSVDAVLMVTILDVGSVLTDTDVIVA
ncbi:MAG: type I secretion C-terminal target domain-containing protein [Acidimicrobiia bacterium]